jgi:hypothetical protein
MTYPTPFCTLFPSLDRVPDLDLEDEMGSTGYIDFLEPEHLTALFMKGTDRYQRKFLSYKFGTGVLTLFQRYTDQSDYWTHGGPLPPGLTIHGGISFRLSQTPETDERVAFVTKAYLEWLAKEEGTSAISELSGFSEGEPSGASKSTDQACRDTDQACGETDKSSEATDEASGTTDQAPGTTDGRR